MAIFTGKVHYINLPVPFIKISTYAHASQDPIFPLADTNFLSFLMFIFNRLRKILPHFMFSFHRSAEEWPLPHLHTYTFRSTHFAVLFFSFEAGRTRFFAFVPVLPRRRASQAPTKAIFGDWFNETETNRVLFMIVKIYGLFFFCL